MHRPAGANVPTQHSWHQTAVPPLCYWAVFQRGHRRRRAREQHPPHSLHHPHCALCSQHVCTSWFDIYLRKSTLKFNLLCWPTSSWCGSVFLRLIVPFHSVTDRRTRATSREEKNLQSFQEQPCEKWVEGSYDVEGPHYFTILAMHIMPPERWRTSRLYFLRRLLVTAHSRKVSAVLTNKYGLDLRLIFYAFFFLLIGSTTNRDWSPNLINQLDCLKLQLDKNGRKPCDIFQCTKLKLARF